MRDIERFGVTLVVILLLLVPGMVASASAQNDLRVEGISHEPSNSKASIAVVNGKFLKEGDQYQGYRVLQITPGAIRVSNIKSGTEHSLSITESKPTLSSYLAQNPLSMLTQSKKTTRQVSTPKAPSSVTPASYGSVPSSSYASSSSSASTSSSSSVSVSSRPAPVSMSAPVPKRSATIHSSSSSGGGTSSTSSGQGGSCVH